MAVVSILTWRGTHPLMCHFPIVNRAIEQGDWAGCFDFWLNRYQTLLGALVAVVAAFYAWIGLHRQLLFSRSQELRVYLHDMRQVESINRHIKDDLFNLLDLQSFGIVFGVRASYEERLRLVDSKRADVEKLKGQRLQVREIYRRLILDEAVRDSLDGFRDAVRLGAAEAKATYNFVHKVLTETQGAPIYADRVSTALGHSSERADQCASAILDAYKKAQVAVEREIQVTEQRIRAANAAMP